MKPLSCETLRNDPELLEALMRQARRERAQALHRFIIAPLARRFARLEWRHVQGRAAQG